MKDILLALIVIVVVVFAIVWMANGLYQSDLTKCAEIASILGTQYKYSFGDGCRLEVREGVFVSKYDIWPWVELKEIK
jgi:hypothetical protein